MKIVQEIRGTTAENNAWLFPSGTITIDSQLLELRLHDGVTVGGHAIPNAASIVGFGTLEFTAVATTSTPGDIVDGDMGKLIRISAAGTYVLPTVVGKPVGSRITVQALVASVVLDPKSGQAINEAGSDLSTSSIGNKEIVTLCVLDGSKWIVVSRH